MSATRYLVASDRLPARVSGEWALEKLYYVERYMHIFNQGMKNRWPQRYFVDLMAGPGRCIIESSGMEFDGSPLLALKTQVPFARCIFLERERHPLAALRARVTDYGDRYRIIPGDCNDPASIETVRRNLEPGSLSLAFADMVGLDVTFETIRSLTRERRMDLLITFQVGDLTRNVPEAAKRGHDERLDDFFGTNRWLEVTHRFDLRQVVANDLASALTDFYCDRLADLGYAHTAQLHHLMRNTRKTPLYRLVLASKNDTATEFFRKISRIEFTGQRSLLD